jgi:hypothetical protein
MNVWFFLYLPIKGRVDHMIREVIQEAENNLIGMDIEINNGVYFCYNNKDKQFICQGTTVAEIRTAFEARYPGKIAYLVGGDTTAVATLKESLKLEVVKE